MDMMVLSVLEMRPLGLALVKISDLCAWREGDQLPYDFRQIAGECPFIPAEFLFPLVTKWCNQLIGTETTQRIVTRSGSVTRQGQIDPAIAKWAVTAEGQDAFERLFYQAVEAKKLRLFDGITRLPMKELPPGGRARFAALGCADTSVSLLASAGGEHVDN